MHSTLRILLQRYWAQRRYASLFEGNYMRNFSPLQKEESGHPSGCFLDAYGPLISGLRVGTQVNAVCFTLWSPARQSHSKPCIHSIIPGERRWVAQTALNSIPYLGLGLMKASSRGRFYSYLYWTSSDNVPNSPGLFGFRFSTKPQVRLKTIMGSPGPYFPI